ncbi:MAG: universal stress protein [Paucibacter sp.]|nr:universal stress protein [Roseateles sp.]
MTATFKHVLVALDDSAHSEKVLQQALRPGLAERLRALLVVKDYGVAELARATFGPGPGPSSLHEQMLSQGRQQLERVLAHALERGQNIDRLVSIADEPWQSIIEHALNERCDLIVMGSGSLGSVSAALLGSQTAHVLSKATMPVLIVR